MNETVKKIVEFFTELLSTKPAFHGKVEVNFFNGKVPNVNVSESIKLQPKQKERTNEE